MRIHSKYFPPDIRDQYEIEGIIAADGYVYIKIIKGMYGLKQEAIIAYNKLIFHMGPHGYYLVPFSAINNCTLGTQDKNNKILLICG